jgi:hypothetical protein
MSVTESKQREAERKRQRRKARHYSTEHQRQTALMEAAENKQENQTMPISTDEEENLNEATNQPSQVEDDQAQHETPTEDLHEVTIEEPANTVPSTVESPKVTALSERNQLWQGYCRLAVTLQRRGNTAEFKTDLQTGQIPRVAEPLLMETALALVAGMPAAGVKRWHWLPAPTADDLADPSGWVARRLTEQRAAQDGAGRNGRWDAQVAQALREPRVGKGTINPVHLQQSKYELDELTRRLNWTKAKHQAEGRGFKREYLDHRSPHYVRVSSGGISNKQVTIMANTIAGVKQRRSFDQNWNIVMKFLDDRETT